MYRYSYQTGTANIVEEESVSLHDCKATQISLKEGTLSFYFPDGFYVARNGSDGRKVFYTGEAKVEFPLLYPDDTDITIYVFTEENGETCVCE